MSRYFAAPDDSGFAVVEEPRSAYLPPGWVEVYRDEYEQRRAGSAADAERSAAAFLREARRPAREAARALRQLGLSAEHAAVLAGLPPADLEEEE